MTDHDLNPLKVTCPKCKSKNVVQVKKHLRKSFHIRAHAPDSEHQCEWCGHKFDVDESGKPLGWGGGDG